MNKKMDKMFCTFAAKRVFLKLQIFLYLMFFLATLTSSLSRSRSFKNQTRSGTFKTRIMGQVTQSCPKFLTIIAILRPWIKELFVLKFNRNTKNWHYYLEFMQCLMFFLATLTSSLSMSTPTRREGANFLPTVIDIWPKNNNNKKIIWLKR